MKLLYDKSLRTKHKKQLSVLQQNRNLIAMELQIRRRNLKYTMVDTHNLELIRMQI